MKIYSYAEHSASAKALAHALNIKRIKHKGSKFTGKRQPIIINWGSTNLPVSVQNCPILNTPDCVERVANKLTFFQLMNDWPYLIPEWTADKTVAENWITENKWLVVCRTKLKGHSGAGIVLAATVEELVDAPLYVRYIPKKEEYRIHVFDNQMIDVQKKAKKRDAENVNYKIRNVANGFIYMRENVVPPDCVRDVALECMLHTGLVFGAVDVVYNEKNNRAFVLEVNTAPGLEGQTVQSYAEAFNNLRGV